MATNLLDLPAEVLQDIAFELVPANCILSSGLLDLTHFLLTCRVIRYPLQPSNCTHLYARIFHTQFDTPAVRALSEEALTEEFFARHRSLATCQQIASLKSLDVPDLHQALWTILLMALEAGDKNREHLGTVNISSICEQVLTSLDRDDFHELKALVLWLRVFTLDKGT